MNWNDSIEQEYRREEWLQAAEQRRLVAMLRTTGPARVRFYQPVLMRLGRQLVAWGWSLQARGGLIETSSSLVIIDGQCR